MAACVSCGYESATPVRFCPERGTEQGPTSSREQRRTVTVVFCDLAGSTALGERVDPERLRALLARYFDEMRSIVEHHGGTVEKLDAQGDAYSDLGEVLLLGGKPDDAATAFEQALDRYERKGNVVMVQRTRERLDPLRSTR